MKNEWKPEKICVIGSCTVFDFDFSKESFHSIREKGFDSVVFGYLDGNWNAEFSRIDLAAAEGPRVYMSVRGPMTRTDLADIDNNRAWVHRQYFGPGGNKWGGSGKEPMCLSEKKVQEH